MSRIGISELLFILILALLIFGPNKLPEIGKSLGKGIREFKEASREIKKAITEDEEEPK
ncbi:MAG: twin-arginine translocase TatA/TatE family subunit [Firmicutes bacterium]|nr:twin-arginine translocase TatA/TatE family subunit [Bacillota bacterium]